MEVFMKVMKWLLAISGTGILAACASTDIKRRSIARKHFLTKQGEKI
jgi:hypothetical protein